jgi:hypothetical protein
MTLSFRHRAFVIKLGIGLVLFFGIYIVTGDVKDMKNILPLPWYRAWPVLFWTVLINIFATWRWHLLLTRLSFPRVTFLHLLKVMTLARIAGLSTSQIVGDIGSRFAFLKIKNMDLKTGSMSIVLDKFFEFLMLASVGFAITAWLLLEPSKQTVPGVYITAAVFIFSLSVWSSPYALRGIKKFLSKERGSLIDASPVSSPVRYALGVLTLAKYLSVVFRFMSILGFCGIGLPMSNVFWGTALAQLGLVIGITPGGLGFVEAGWTGALHVFRISPAEIAQFLIVQRLLIFACVILVGAIAVILGKIFTLRESALLRR